MADIEYREIRRPSVGEVVTRGKQYMGAGHWAGSSLKVRVLGACGPDDYYVAPAWHGPDADWTEIVHIQSLVGCHTFARE